MIHKRMTKTEDKMLATFEIPGCVWAKRSHLVGDHTDWTRENLALRLTRQGTWQVQVELDTGSENCFRYLVDRERWGADWHADRHTLGAYGLSDWVVVAQLPEHRRELV